MYKFGSIAIFTGLYRATNETFVSNELFLLQKSGIRGTIFYEQINKDNVQPVNNSIKFSFYSIYEYPFDSFKKRKTRVFFTHLALLIGNPYGYFSAVILLLQMLTWENFFLFIRAGLIGKELLKKETSNIYIHDGAKVTLMGIFCSCLIKIPCTIIFHTEYLFAYSNLLQTKILTADSSIFQSEYSKQYAISKIHASKRTQKKMHVISSPGIDTSYFKPSKYTINSYSRKIKISAIGRLEKMKGFELLIHAVDILTNQGEDVECDIIGYGTQQKNLETLIHNLKLENKVFLRGAIGHTKELISLLNESDYFILPSLIDEKGDRDMQPNAIKEAMSMEKIVITSNLGGIKEVIKNEVNGFLIDNVTSEDIVATVKKIKKMPISKIQTIRKNARKTIISKYSNQQINEKLIHMLAKQFSNSLEKL